jgi:hypothetical protein
VALRGSVVPRANEASAGEIARDTSTGGATVSVADPLIAPEVAVMVDVPCPELDATPVPLTVATAVADELQLADVVRFCVLPSL